MVGVVAFGLVYVLNHAEGLGAAHTTITYPCPGRGGSVGWGHVPQGKRRLGEPPGGGLPLLGGVGSLSTGTCSGSSPLAVGLNGPAWPSCAWPASSSSLSSASRASTWCWSRGGALPTSRYRPLGGGPCCDRDGVPDAERVTAALGPWGVRARLQGHALRGPV